MTDEPPTVDLGSTEAEVDWMSYGRGKDPAEAVNMTASELRAWADHECSDEASVKPAEVRERVLSVLETPKGDWGAREVRDANRMLFLLKHMRDLPQGDASGDCPSDRDIALMNWGYRPESADVDL